MRPFLIAPSILSADPLAIGASIDSLKGRGDWIHLDIMDGHFVPNLTYGPMLLRALRRRYVDAVIDAHLMVTPTENFLDMFLLEKPDILSIHVETTLHLHRALSMIREKGVRPGVVVNPGTPVSLIEPVLHLVDVVLLMSVNPGFGGQSFIPQELSKAVTLCQWRAARNLDFLIEMDGGLGEATLPEALRAGVDVAVMGNALFGTPDPAATADRMKTIAMEVLNCG